MNPAALPLSKRTPALRWRPVASKRFANAHTEGVAIPALGDIGSKIHMVLFTELKTQSTTSGRQEAAALQKLQRLIPARYHTTEPAEHHKTKTLRQNQTVFQLGCERVASEVFARRVASQFVTSAVDAIPVERGAPPVPQK